MGRDTHDGRQKLHETKVGSSTRSANLAAAMQYTSTKWKDWISDKAFRTSQSLRAEPPGTISKAFWNRFETYRSLLPSPF